MRNLIPVAVKLERLSLEEFPDSAFTRLAPSRMIHLRIHIGIKAIFVGRSLLPSSLGLLLDKADSDDGLDALESVLPGNHQAYRRPILVR